jgi:hypothetical protein
MISRRSLLSSPYRTPTLSLLLASIAASAGASCTNDPPTVTPPAPKTCEGGEPISFTEGLNLAVAVDSIAFYEGSTQHLCIVPEYELVSDSGEACESTDDRASCADEVERLVQGSADWGKYENFFSASWGLLVVTGSTDLIAELGGPVQELTDGTCGSGDRGGPRLMGAGGVRPPLGEGGADGQGGMGGAPSADPLSDSVTTISDRETLLTLLGTIDTTNEAALVMWANSFDPPCEISESGDGYTGRVTAMIGDCPITYQDFALHVAADGTFTASETGSPNETNVCVGRRPSGLLGATGEACAPEFEAAWLASVARLETAAVVAFAQLSRELERLGAPEELILRARSAALDEIRHARGTHRLAVARGAQVLPAVTQLERERSLLSLAVENAVEGCVRECWGALLAHYQAGHALDPQVRELWQTIAQEESGHAVLSMDLAVWLNAQLSSAEQAVVEAARLRAIQQLEVELGQPEPESLALGLPDRATRLALFAALEEQVLLPRAA